MESGPSYKATAGSADTTASVDPAAVGPVPDDAVVCSIPDSRNRRPDGHSSENISDS